MTQQAVIYLRVSTEDQTRGMSLESQESICRAYCERESIKVDRVFVDRGVSAKTDLRAEFQAMINYCRSSKGRVTHAVIYKLDRFSREASLSAMWNRMDSQQRRAFACVLYPDGLVWSNDLVRTGVSGSLFEKLRAFTSPQLSLASPTGTNSNRAVIYDLLNAFKPLLEFAA